MYIFREMSQENNIQVLFISDISVTFYETERFVPRKMRCIFLIRYFTLNFLSSPA